MSHIDTLNAMHLRASVDLETMYQTMAEGLSYRSYRAASDIEQLHPEVEALTAVLRFVAAFDANVNGTEHLIRFDDDGWTMEHPARERVLGSLLECTYRGPDLDPQVRGVFILNPDGTNGQPCDPDGNLREAYKALTQGEPGDE